MAQDLIGPGNKYSSGYDLLMRNSATALGKTGGLNSVMGRDAAASFVNYLGGAAGGSSPYAYGTLIDILRGQGKTDPTRLNTELMGIDRGTQSNQRAAQAALAQRGVGNSGLSAALQAAIGSAGVGQRSDAMARENALQEQRKRDDLQLFHDLIIGPATDQQALYSGQYAGDRADRNNKDAAKMSAYASLLGGLVGLI